MKIQNRHKEEVQAVMTLMGGRELHPVQEPIVERDRSLEKEKEEKLHNPQPPTEEKLSDPPSVKKNNNDKVTILGSHDRLQVH